jgi:hypothetical protein
MEHESGKRKLGEIFSEEDGSATPCYFGEGLCEKPGCKNKVLCLVTATFHRVDDSIVYAEC